MGTQHNRQAFARVRPYAIPHERLGEHRGLETNRSALISRFRFAHTPALDSTVVAQNGIAFQTGLLAGSVSVTIRLDATALGWARATLAALGEFPGQLASNQEAGRQVAT